MTSTTFFIIFIPILSILLLTINLILAPHNPYQEKDSAFECGFHSFLGQNRTQFSVSFFIFALLFLLFDLEILLVYPYSVSGYTNDIYGLIVMLLFFGLLTLGFIFELGKNALSIESKQTSLSNNEDTPQPIIFITLLKSSILPGLTELLVIDYLEKLSRSCTSCKNIFTSCKNILTSCKNILTSCKNILTSCKNIFTSCKNRFILYKNRFLSLFSFDAPKPHGFPSLLLRSTGHGSSNQQPQVPVDRPEVPGITTQARFNNFYEWRQWSEANGPKYFDIDNKVSNNIATPAEKAWYEENKDRVFDCPSEWKDAPSPVEQPDLFKAREFLKDNSVKPEYDEARKKVREAAGMPTTRKETNRLEDERDRNNFLYPVFSFSIFRFLLPIFHLFSFFFSISVLFIIYLNIDINFVIPYINLNFLDLTFILLILQFVNLLRKCYKTVNVIKSLVAENNYKEISYIIYICIVFIIFIWLIT